MDNNSSFSERFGYRLESLLEEKGEAKISNAYDLLVDKNGNPIIARSTLYKYVSGKQLPNIDIAAQIADALDVSGDYILLRSNLSNPNHSLNELHLTDAAYNSIKNITSKKTESGRPSQAEALMFLLSNEALLSRLLNFLSLTIWNESQKRYYDEILKIVDEEYSEFNFNKNVLTKQKRKYNQDHDIAAYNLSDTISRIANHATRQYQSTPAYKENLNKTLALLQYCAENAPNGSTIKLTTPEDGFAKVESSYESKINAIEFYNKVKDDPDWQTFFESYSKGNIRFLTEEEQMEANNFKPKHTIK